MTTNQIEKRISELEKRTGTGERLRIVVLEVEDWPNGEPRQKEPYDPADFDITHHPAYDLWWPKREPVDSDKAEATP